MNRFPALLIVCILLFSSTVAAAEIPGAAVQYLRNNYPKYEISDSAVVGDIDGDGISDLAVILTFSHEPEYHVKLVVLKGTAGGTFKLMSASQNSASPQHGVDLLIRKRSLFVNIFHSGDGTMNSFYQSQYQVRNGRLVLIGSEATAEAATAIAPDDPFMDNQTSTNYLTGQIIKTYKRKGKVVSTLKRTIAVSPLTALDDSEL